MGLKSDLGKQIKNGRLFVETTTPKGVTCVIFDGCQTMFTVAAMIKRTLEEKKNHSTYSCSLTIFRQK